MQDVYEFFALEFWNIYPAIGDSVITKKWILTMIANPRNQIPSTNRLPCKKITQKLII